MKTLQLKPNIQMLSSETSLPKLLPEFTFDSIYNHHVATFEGIYNDFAIIVEHTG